MEKGGCVDPVCRVIFIIIFTGNRFMSGETIGALMLVCWNVNELEVEEEDSCDPVVYGSVWLYVWVAEHAFDILGIHLDD